MPLESILPSARITFGLCSLALLGIILAMIRRGSIKEKYALLWLPLGFGFLVTSLFPELLVRISNRIHLHYMTVVVLGVIVLFTTILLYFTARLSQLREEVKSLAQAIAIANVRAGTGETRTGPSETWLPAAGKPVPEADQKDGRAANRA